MQEEYKRKNNRLDGYDYSESGFYFITICTDKKIHLFGEIKGEKMHYTKIGEIANSNILKIQEVYRNTKLHEYVIMPNHIHMVIEIENQDGRSVSTIIKKYKEWITKEVEKQIWQKSYYDHIIRDEKDYYRIVKYIDENILKWSLDEYY